MAASAFRPSLALASATAAWVRPKEVHKIQALFHAELAAQEVHGLNAVGAFVDQVDLLVAHHLLNRILTAVAVAAVSLYGQSEHTSMPLSVQ